MIGGGCVDKCELCELGLFERDADIVVWRCLPDANSAAFRAVRQKFASELVPRFWFAQPPLLTTTDRFMCLATIIRMSSSRFARYYNRDGQDDLKLLTASHSEELLIDSRRP